ncbi:MAG: type secretion system pseudopilin TklG [Pseudomonadota bacterium]|jgi:type II secretory pathway pseudopilin PulG
MTARPRRQRGFTYLLLLGFIAITGAGLAALGEIWQLSRQREREADLLYVGNEYRQAIGRYLAASTGGLARYPAKLEDLLLDPRFPDSRRYLRELYPDPLTGRHDWQLITAPQGGIIGVASSSTARPLKEAGFPVQLAAFEALASRQGDKLSYRDWVFSYEPSLPLLRR